MKKPIAEDSDYNLRQVNPATPIVQIKDTHEVDMAKAQVYRAAKCAMEIHKMLKMVDNLEGWMQSKITLAADYLESVSSNLEYDIVSATTEPTVAMDNSEAPVFVETAQQDAKAAGYAAAHTVIRNGKAVNPHKPGTPDHSKWEQGRKEAERTSKQPGVMSEQQVDEVMFPQLRKDVKDIAQTASAAAKKFWHGTPEEQEQHRQELEARWMHELKGVPGAAHMARTLAARGKKP